jgi:hypothetical protein
VPSRRTIQLLVLVTGAVLLTGTLTLAALSDEPSKPGPRVSEAQATGSPVAPPGEHSTSGPPAAAPARATPPAGVTCEPSWGYFDNPVMHYGVCIPPGWGFSDFTGPAPMDTVPGVQLESLHLLSPSGFPWVRGRLPFDAIATRSMLDVELDVLPAEVKVTTECEPTTPVDLDGARALACEQFYDSTGLPASSGPLRAIKVIVPLLQTPSDDPAGNLEGARLLVIMRARATASAKEVDTLWKIARSVRAY